MTMAKGAAGVHRGSRITLSIPSVLSRTMKAVYKTVAERLPKSSLIQRSGQTCLTAQAVICVRLDYELPKDVPVKVRRFVFGRLEESTSNRIEYGTALFSYVVDARPTAKTITERLKRYRRSMRLIVEDPEIQGGAATFKVQRNPSARASCCRTIATGCYGSGITRRLPEPHARDGRGRAHLCTGAPAQGTPA
jgi:hypothetical protein